MSAQQSNVTVLATHRAGGGESWEPIDAVRETLQLIEAGTIKPKAIVICMLEEHGDGGVSLSFNNASPNVAMALGALELTKQRIINDA